MSRFASCLALLLLTSAHNAHAFIIGDAKVIDGDTIEISNQRIRLHGIDAPETKQTCNLNDQEWDCGIDATRALTNIIGINKLYCREHDRDRYGRIVAACNIGSPEGLNISAAMVRQGWAVAFRRYSNDYLAEEAEAKAAKIGLWASQFISPWDWRNGYRTKDAKDVRPDTCRIKGNISRQGARIYHVPGGRFYSRTRIDATRGERWFCSEAEAKKAGWQRAKN